MPGCTARRGLRLRHAGEMLGALVDLVLPTRCAGCGCHGAALCEQCRPSGPPVRSAALPGLPVLAAGVYGDALRSALIKYKERGRRELAAPLAGLLAGVMADLLAHRSGASLRADCLRTEGLRVFVVPIPSSRSARGERGGDPLARLAARAARRCGLRVAADALCITRAVHDSAGLGRADRRANLDHAFDARPPPPRTLAVIVDDIVTTGATLREAHRALTAIGWPVLGVAAVAATPLPPSSSWRPGR